MKKCVSTGGGKMLKALWKLSKKGFPLWPEYFPQMARLLLNKRYKEATALWYCVSDHVAPEAVDFINVITKETITTSDYRALLRRGYKTVSEQLETGRL